MNIYGFDKTSLLNYPEHVAATVFTGGCNMRCPFCHNGELVLNPPADMKIPEDEVIAHLKKRCNVLQGLCITGGEPTLQPDLTEFITRVRSLGYKIKLDTNGLKPDILSELTDKGMLDYVAIDIKAGRNGYAAACGLDPASTGQLTDAITRSVEKLILSGMEYELRTTVVKGIHTSADFEDIHDWMKEMLNSAGRDKIRAYYLQSYVDRDTVLDRSAGFDSYSHEELNEFASIFTDITETVSVRGME